jgi:hypothetical protein
MKFVLVCTGINLFVLCTTFHYIKYNIYCLTLFPRSMFHVRRHTTSI